MKRINLNQITDGNHVGNTTSLTKFNKRVQELNCNISEIIEGGLCGNFNQNDFDTALNDLSYFVKSSFVLSDEDYTKYEENECDIFSEMLRTKK